MMVIPGNDVSGVGMAVVQRFRHLTNNIWVVFYRVMYFILCDKPCGVPIKVNRFGKCVDSVVKNGNPYRRHLGSGTVIDIINFFKSNSKMPILISIVFVISIAVLVRHKWKRYKVRQAAETEEQVPPPYVPPAEPINENQQPDV